MLLFKATFKSVIDTYMRQIFKAAFLLFFFSFFRISNLVPHTLTSFNPLEQLCRADIFFAHPGAHVLVKWSKTMQSQNTVKILKNSSPSLSSYLPSQDTQKPLVTYTER